MNNFLLPLALLVGSQAVFSQQLPSAGGQLQQIPPSPVPPRAPPEVRIEQRTSPAGAGAEQVRIVVNALKVSGATAFAESELLALTGFTPGSELTLTDLQAIAARITDHYHRNGYFVAQAFVPAQDIKDNVVTIAVSEGRYGNVTLRNQTTLSDQVARASLEGLNEGDAITAGPLETRLLLLSDLQGVIVRSTLVPGTAPGASDLIVEVTSGQRVSGSVDADNSGDRYTGAYRVGTTVNVNNPLGLGDVASLRALTAGSGLNYARVSYQVPWRRAQFGAAYSWLDYSLGKEFKSLQANGTARVASIFGRYALVRSRTDNLYAQLGYDDKTFQDKVDSIPSVTDKNSHLLMASVYGDHLDSVGGGGMNSFSLTWATGKLDIRTPAARDADARTAQTNGRFDKISFAAMRVQRLGGPFSVFGSIGGQAASKNLDISEKMELGGMNAVRAYPEGEAYADEGVLVSVEGRMDLPKASNTPGEVQLIAFADAGNVTLDKEPWVAGSNRRRLAGAGVGVNWTDPGNFVVRAYYAHKLGNQIATSSPDQSGRFWIQLVKYF